MKFDFGVKSDISSVRRSNQYSAFADAVRTLNGKVFWNSLRWNGRTF